ncbi:helix-turn-helix domain-containing protein [Streptomyces sp. 3213.3]|uniref:helix-turn-helix domain-containing protein n=1 Tax=Streptomyces sp. 3213.3 TaxID=1855348 RepID=UPI001F2349DA|nr:helix-turn-helix transcriptional regulator [Streptomyces sp. 3213.3]
MGIPEYGERRRVSGLRREELARPAGVGVSYYTRLEQGSSLNASAEVLEALARALGLDEVERVPSARSGRRGAAARHPAQVRAGAGR